MSGSRTRMGFKGPFPPPALIYAGNLLGSGQGELTGSKGAGDVVSQGAGLAREAAKEILAVCSSVIFGMRSPLIA
jgi:hypothetical protein